VVANRPNRRQCASRFQAFFLNGERGPCFHIMHEPGGVPVRGCVLYVHPFAEELNKSRRMVALQARRMAAEGYAVLMPDLYGCGDSEGDFGEARWETWLADLRRAVDHLQEQFEAPLVLWGLRTGCLLISDLVKADTRPPAAALFWQPVVNGELFFNQFLRLRMAAGIMGGQKENTSQLRKRLEAGETLEIAGYELHPELAASLAAARVEPPPGVPIGWLEVTQGDQAELPPASARVVDAWQSKGQRVAVSMVQGDPFWNTQEIREVPALLDETMRCLREMG
jgi:exosortase A-associated hydrolase 2